MEDGLKLQGIIPPMLTPLTQDRELDVMALHRLIQHMVKGGVNGLFLFGSSGEGPWLSNKQIQQVLTATTSIIEGRIPILVGVLEAGTQKVLETIDFIQEVGGADAIVVTTPYYFGTNAEDQVEHFQTIAQHTKLPIVLYNIPPTTHHTIAVSTVKRLLHISNIIGIKDSAGDELAFEGFLKLKDTRPDFSVLQGAERLAAPSLIAGADGIVPGLGNLVPLMFDTMLTQVKNQNNDAAMSQQKMINTLGELHNQDYWLKCLKYGAKLMGFGSGATVSHCDDLSPAAKTTISGLMTPYILRSNGQTPS